ncbi:MAG: TlpA family protein disulfide reductase [Fusobacteriaceae bacterium]
MKKILFVLLMLCLGSVGIFAEVEKPVSSKFKVGDKLPNITVKSFDGKETISTDSFRGKKIILNFTATWCPYCQEEKKIFNVDYNNKYKNNPNYVVIVLFGYGGGEGQDTVAKAQKYMSDSKYNFPVFFDPNKQILNQMGVSTIPTTFLIDEKGIITEMGGEYYNLPSLKTSLPIKVPQIKK